MRKFVNLFIVVALVMLLASPIFAVSNNPEITRTQTIYSILDWNGSTQNTSVVNWLRINGEGELKIADNPQLENISSLHPTATFANSEWNIVSKGNADLFYTGTTDKKLPVEVDIEILLDDKKINPSDISGKSGKLDFKFTFTNTLSHEEIISWMVGDKLTEKEETIYTPMTIMLQAEIPADNYDKLTAPTAFQMTVGNNKSLMWSTFPAPITTVEFSITDDNLTLPSISISIMPVAPNFPTPEIDTSLMTLMSSMGDTGELLEMMDGSSSLDMSSALENIEGMEGMTTAMQEMVNSADEGMEGITQLFEGYSLSFTQIRDGADGLITLAESHKMILEMIRDEMSKSSAGITASSNAITDAKSATGKVSSSLFGIQFYLEDMESSLKELRKLTTDEQLLEQISNLDTSVSKSLTKLEAVKGNADTASNLLKILSDGGVLDGVEVPAMSETPEMMSMLDDTLSALISGGEIQDMEIPGLTTTIDGLKGISEGITMMLDGGEMEGNVIPAWNEIPVMISSSAGNMDIFINGGEINGITIPSQEELQKMIEEFKISLEAAAPLQEKMDEFSEKFQKAIDEIGGAEKLEEATQNTEELLLGETAKFERMKELAKEYTTFVGDTPGSDSSVLFVIKLKKSSDQTVEENSETSPINTDDNNPYKNIEKNRLYLLIIAIIIIILAIVVNWLYKRKYSDK